MQYRESLVLINIRINELTLNRDLQLDKNGLFYDLSDRIKILSEMQEELRVMVVEIENYYKKGWWRDEKITCNARKPRKLVYREPIYD